jgi:hypothetical protein
MGCAFYGVAGGKSSHAKEFKPYKLFKARMNTNDD